MYSDTERWIKSCTKCSQRKTPKIMTRISLNPINEAKLPLEMLGVDILCGIPETINTYYVSLIIQLVELKFSFEENGCKNHCQNIH